MPMLDMPVRELETYQGTNPRPQDHDIYWENALKELDSVEPCATVSPASFQAPYADCYDLYFTGVHGARVYAKLLVPHGLDICDARGRLAGPQAEYNGKRCPAMLHFHGYSGASSGWTYYLPYVAAGMVVAALDCRGQGGRSEDKGGVTGNTLHGHIIRGLDGPADHLLFRDIFLDTAELAHLVMDLPCVDPTRVAATGGSQGGGLTLACCSLVPQIRRAAACFPFLSDYKRVWDMDLDLDAYLELKEYFRLFDPRHEREQEVFTKLGYIDIQYLVPRIKAEVLLFTGLMDNICPPSTQYAAYNKMTCPKRHILYPDFGHEDLPDCDDIIFRYFTEMCKEDWN